MTSILQYFIKRIKFACCLIGILLQISIIDCYCLTAKFSVEMKGPCVPAVAIITNESSQGTGITYQWNFGQGAITYVSAPVLEEVYTTPGHYVIKLTVINGSLRDSTSDSIDVSIGPIAKFTVDATQGCAPFKVNFKNTSTSINGFKDVLWDFRNGDVLNGNNVSYTYVQPGNYDVLLTVTDNNGCKDYIESKSLIMVTNRPVANFTASDTFACEPPLNVSFFNKSTGQPSLKYYWNFGNGTHSTDINKSVDYTSNGNYDVKLTVTDAFGCTDSITKSSFIKIGKVAGRIYARYEDGRNASTALLCPGKITFWFSLAGQTDYTWQVHYKNTTLFFYGSNEFTLQADSGNVSIKLVYGKLSDCADSISTTYLIDYLKADFSINDTTGCELPHITNLINLSKNAVTYNWNLPFDSISHSKNISYTIPKKLTYAQMYSHNSIQMNFDFTLTAINSDGCRDSITKTVNIHLPVARFMPDKSSGCLPLAVTFSDSSHSDLPIEKWIYKFGNDSVISLNRNPVTYTFSNPGEYKAILIIKTDQNCIDTSDNVLIKVGEKLLPDFSVSPSNVCNSDTITLTGQSNFKDSVDYWNYSCPGVFNTGSGKNSDALAFIHADTSGAKNIKLEVDYNGCISDTVKKNIFTVNGPNGSFYDSLSCDSPLFYTFISKIKPVTSLAWNIDTIAINNKDSVTYLFTHSGNYNVKLTAVDNVSHCTLIRNKIITVRLVKADYNINPIYCLGDSINFNAIKSADYISHCYNEGFLWNFNDNSPPRRTYMPQYIYTYKNRGSYHPLLTVLADNGCTDTLSRFVKIQQPTPTFTIDKNKGCVPQIDVTFINTSIDSSITGWTWLFGDTATNYNSKSIVHSYINNTSKDYTAGLRVVDNYGCSVTTYKTISLVKVSADFQAIDNALCLGDDASFIISAKNLGRYKWYFGDGDTSNNNNTHTYLTAGNFDVALVAYLGMCKDSVMKSKYISVEKADAGYLVSDSLFKCYPATVNFTHTGASSNIVDGTWAFGNGAHSNTYSNTAQYTYTSTGTYNTSLWIKTLNNCQATASKKIYITGPVATFDFSPKQICYGGQVSFHIDQTQNVSETRWLFGDGETSDLASPTHNYFARGYVVPALWVKNNDCETTIITDSIMISRLTVDFNFKDNKSSLCLGQELIANNLSRNLSSSVWKINDVISSNRAQLTDIYPDHLGEYNVKLVVTDNYNCHDSITKNLVVIPIPNYKITGDTSICKGDSTKLSVTSNPLWSISWSPASSLNNSTSFNPEAKPDINTKYIAFVTDTNGCSASDSIYIFVKQPSSLIFIPNGDTSINIGERIQLHIISNSGKTTYSWSPFYNISCLYCNNPFVSPEHDITYKAIIKDECFVTTKEFNIKVIINYFLEAPKAFTPNGDTHNDKFLFESKNIKTFNLKIFNRWGNIVFETDDLLEGWDGTCNGKMQNIDTYTYIVKAETGSGYKFEKKGSLLLLK